jgi:predicted HTH domain antitoxin
MSEPIYFKLPSQIKEETDLYVESGFFDNRSELIREALRDYLDKLRSRHKDIAIELYRQDKISLGKAARLSGVGYERMKDILAQRKIPIRASPANPREADDDLQNLRR